MNIYFDSQNGGTSTLPTNVVFTNIETDNLIIHNSLSIDGLNKGSILIGENNTNDVGELELGPQNYALISDKNNSGLPQWRNYLAGINYIETNQIRIPNVVSGDLLTGDIADNGFLARLPCGANNTVLYSNGNELGWQYKYAGNSYFNTTPNTQIPIPILFPQNMINNNGLNFVAGRYYKITVSARIASLYNTIFSLSFNGNIVASFEYNGNNDMARSFRYIATNDGAVVIALLGLSTNVVPNDLLFNFEIFAEEFGPN